MVGWCAGLDRRTIRVPGGQTEVRRAVHAQRQLARAVQHCEVVGRQLLMGGAPTTEPPTATGVPRCGSTCIRNRQQLKSSLPQRAWQAVQLCQYMAASTFASAGCTAAGNMNNQLVSVQYCPDAIGAPATHQPGAMLDHVGSVRVCCWMTSLVRKPKWYGHHRARLQREMSPFAVCRKLS